MDGDQPIEQVLGHQQRAVSTPDLRSSGSSPAPDDIPSGCSRRAPKLRGARRNSPSPGPPLSRNDRTEKLGSRSGSQGLPPSGRNQDVRTKMHKLRSQNRTPTELIYAAANDESFREGKDMSVHRASPVVITPNGRGDDVYSYLKESAPHEADLNNEVAALNGFNDAWTYALSARTSKKPWKKNRGKYNPSESLENIQKELQRKQVRTVITRPGSSQGDPYSIDKSSKSRVKTSLTRPASCTAEIHTPGEHTRQRIDNLYDEVKDQSFLSVASDGPNSENPYEEVRFGQRNKRGKLS